MSDSSLPGPRYSIWQGLNAALAMGMRALEEVRELAGRPAPQRGEDGLGFDDLTVEQTGDRSFTVKFVRGEIVKEFPFVIPSLIYRGVYREGETYQRGDTVTLSGSLWHANADTTAKPEEHVKSDWTLAAKRGREGKPGAVGRAGKDGADGRPGRDLTPRS